MKKIENKLIDECVYEEKLENGMTILISPKHNTWYDNFNFAKA